MKARKCLKKGYFSILAHVKERKSDEKKLEEVPVVREFPEIFLDELPGLPPSRQVEFHVDITPEARPSSLSTISPSPVINARVV